MEKRFAFIGAGNMASAIIGGLTDRAAADAVPEAQITLFDKNPAQYDRYGTGFVRASSAADAARDADIVVLAIKPQNYAEVLDELGRTDTHGKIFISIAAGISTAFVETYLGSDAAVVRTMPNTPLLLGEGATALCRTSNVPEEDFARVRSAFSCCGVTQEIDEAQMNAVIAVSGSSPAYLYLLAKLTCDYAAQQGIDPKTALTLFCQTMKGSADMLLNSGKDPQALMDMVTSKGGTTFALLNVLKEQGFNEAMISSFEACTHRAEELSM